MVRHPRLLQIGCLDKAGLSFLRRRRDKWFICPAPSSLWFLIGYDSSHVFLFPGTSMSHSSVPSWCPPGRPDTCAAEFHSTLETMGEAKPWGRGGGEWAQLQEQLEEAQRMRLVSDTLPHTLVTSTIQLARTHLKLSSSIRTRWCCVPVSSLGLCLHIHWLCSTLPGSQFAS